MEEIHIVSILFRQSMNFQGKTWKNGTGRLETTIMYVTRNLTMLIHVKVQYNFPQEPYPVGKIAEKAVC